MRLRVSTVTSVSRPLPARTAPQYRGRDRIRTRPKMVSKPMPERHVALHRSGSAATKTSRSTSIPARAEVESRPRAAKVVPGWLLGAAPSVKSAEDRLSTPRSACVRAVFDREIGGVAPSTDRWVPTWWVIATAAWTWRSSPGSATPPPPRSKAAPPPPDVDHQRRRDAGREGPGRHPRDLPLRVDLGIHMTLLCDVKWPSRC